MAKTKRNIVGLRFSALKVVEDLGGNKCRCICKCGNEKIVYKNNLISGNTKSCGCLKKGRTGRKKGGKNFERKDEPFKLTADNYYSIEANMEYVSASQYSDFFGHRLGMQKGCESAALAKARGELIEKPTTPMLIGSYVDAFFEGTLEKFVEEHPEVISTRGATAGELKSEYKQAQTMIERAIRDKLFMQFMKGKKQVIMTGEIEGVKVKIKIDSTDGKRITDLKTVKSIYDTFFVPTSGERVNFIEWWQYDRQLAIYREIYRQNTGDILPCYIAAISKDKTDGIAHPRLAVIEIPPPLMDARLIEVMQNITHIQALKNGDFEPIPCGSCDYCADTLPLDRVYAPDELVLSM